MDIVKFLSDSFIYILFIGVILIFAIIGYLVDSSRNKNREKSDTKTESITPVNTPTPIDISNVKLGDSINKPLAGVSPQNSIATERPVMKEEKPNISNEGPHI